MTNISVVNTQSTNYSYQFFESCMLKLCCNISFALQTETQTHPVFNEFIPNLVFLSTTVRISWLMVPTFRRGNEMEIHTHISCTRYCKLCLKNIHCTELNCFIASFACSIFFPQPIQIHELTHDFHSAQLTYYSHIYM
jgi:hypothetical protein